MMSRAILLVGILVSSFLMHTVTADNCAESGQSQCPGPCCKKESKRDDSDPYHCKVNGKETYCELACCGDRCCTVDDF